MSLKVVDAVPEFTPDRSLGARFHLLWGNER